MAERDDAAAPATPVALPFAVGLRIEIATLAIALVAAALGAFLAPGNALLDVGPIEFVQRPGGRPFIVQRMQARLPFVGDVRYHAEIVEVALPGGPPPVDRHACEGAGVVPMEGRAGGEKRMSVEAWVNDPDCTLRRGFTYYATVTWTFRFVGITKTMTQRTGTVTMPIVRTEVSPSFPPGL